MADKDKRFAEGDDGETVVDMNVDGMPWYNPRLKGEQPASSDSELTPEQMRTYRWAAIKAGLMVALIFAVAFALFIAFCDFVWFR